MAQGGRQILQFAPTRAAPDDASQSSYDREADNIASHLNILQRRRSISISATNWRHLFTTELAGKNFPGFVGHCLLELTNIKFALASFVINNLRRRYRRSILGFGWSLLNPLLTMGVMTLVFSLLWKDDARSFGVYVFTGLLPWTYMVEAIMAGSQSIVASEAFLKKVYIPKTFFPLVSVSTETVNFVLSMVSLMCLAALFGLKITGSLFFLPFACALTFMFTYAISLMLAIATVYFRDLTHIIKVVLGTAFYLVPVVYKVEMVPIHYRALFELNPAFHFIKLFREIIYYSIAPSMQDWINATAVTVITLTVAFYILMKTERDLIYRL